MLSQPNIIWPDGKRFAFTIFDDTDKADVSNVKPVYDFLYEHGLRTTKSVWPLRGSATPINGGATCEDPDYVAWLLELQHRGFEIGYHMATFHSSPRHETIRALNRFTQLFGQPPATMANHVGCDDNLYWGINRLTGAHRWLYRLRHGNERRSYGEDTNSDFFWGDLCHDTIRYVRNFVFPDINTLNACPFMPYHDPERPFVRYFFASSEGSSVDSFNHCISETNQDRLEAEGGACIMYTHFAFGHCTNRGLNPRFRTLLERIATKNGWFVPVATLLDFLRDQRTAHDISSIERRKLERRWMWTKFRRGTS